MQMTMRLVRLWLWCAVVVVAVLCLGGCKEDGSAQAGDGALVMATDAAFFPYEYVEDGEVVGLDVDMAREMGRRMGVAVRVENMEFDSVIAAVQAGKVDFAASGITVSADREKQVNFTRPYAVAQQVVLVSVGSALQRPQDLQGVRVGVQSGTTGDLYVKEHFGEPERYSNGPMAVAALKAGKVDAVVLDDLPAKEHAARNPGLQVLAEPLTREAYAVAVGKDKPELLARMNEALAAMEQDGTLARLAADYAQRELPQEGQGMWGAFYHNFVKDGRWRYLADGLVVTVEISAAAALIGIVLGALIGVVRSTAEQTGRLRCLDFFCRLYLTVVRGTPVVVQLLIIYFVIFGSVEVSKVLVAIVAFGLNSAAYVAEIVRSGIMAVDRGQMEAGRSLGLGYGYTMRAVVMPQAFKNVLPALGNEFIVLLKETSICGYIALQDLTKGGNIILSQTYDAFLPLMAVALIYLLMVVGLSALLRKLERRLKKNER